MVSSRFRLVLKSVEQYELVEFWRLSCARPSLFVFSELELNCMICSLLSAGVSVRALKLTAAEDKVSVNVRQNASLHWTFHINKGETYRILWATSTVDAAGTPRMKDVLFSKTEKQAIATPSSKMPPRYARRVKILPPATLFIQRVDLSDEGFYICEITTAFRAIRKAINLSVIG